ncbi:MAG: Shedu anti-phage system protein SduA domain-containing protein [Dissulfurispiraceae bacterium]
METTLSPYITIQYDNPAHQEMLVKHMAESTKKDEMLKTWEHLLDSDSKECKVQKYLERFPYFLPGLYDYHNGPRRGVIISKFPFGNDYESDFAFVTLNSMMLQFTFVEIERHRKKIFNRNSSFTQDFNHSLQQIRDWKLWGEKNIEILLSMCADLFQGYNIKNDHKTVRCYLVYGRRDEVESSQLRKEKWSTVAISNEKSIVVSTYDRLTANVAILPTDRIQHNLAVCRYKKRGFFLMADRLRNN